MRTSSDFFDKLPDRFEELNAPFVPRATVPFKTDKINPKNLPPIPKVYYPVFTRPPTPQKTALELVQQEIQKEVSDLQQKKPSLDQLIQNALRQNAQLESQKQTKVITISKIAPPTQNHIKVPLKKPLLSPTKPFQKPTQDLWWPSEQEIISEKLRKANLNKMTAKTPTPIITPTHEPVVKASPPKPAAPIPAHAVTKLPSPSNNSATQVVKSVFHISTNIINYFLFTINPESDPFGDNNRQLIIYGIKTGAYLTVMAGIFELTRNLKIGLSLNGILEVTSIFLISAILFFFGENLNILFKPINPYQVHEVV